MRFAALYASYEGARGPWIFGDGFERGDTLDWSSSLP